MKKDCTVLDHDQALDWAVELRCLAARARHLGTTLGGEPGRLRDYRWDVCMDIASDLTVLANKVKPLVHAPAKAKKPSAMRQVTVDRLINGKRIRVQSRRMPFAVCVEGRT